jgi:hypothetical protein
MATTEDAKNALKAAVFERQQPAPVWLTRDERKQRDKIDRNMQAISARLAEIHRSRRESVPKPPALVFFGPPRPPESRRGPSLPPFIVDAAGPDGVVHRHRGDLDHNGIYKIEEIDMNEDISPARAE